MIGTWWKPKCTPLNTVLGNAACHEPIATYDNNRCGRMDDEPQIAPVEDVTASSSDDLPQVPAPRVKRKGGAPKARRPAEDVVSVEKMLCKSSSCKRNCKEQFRGNTARGELLRFRTQWRELHKTDQDEVAAYMMVHS